MWKANKCDFSHISFLLKRCSLLAGSPLVLTKPHAKFSFFLLCQLHPCISKQANGINLSTCRALHHGQERQAVQGGEHRQTVSISPGKPGWMTPKLTCRPTTYCISKSMKSTWSRFKSEMHLISVLNKIWWNLIIIIY